jgi:hypothetical protein
VVPWRALLLVGVLSLLLGIALERGLLAAHPTSLPSGDRGVASHRGLASLPAAAQGPVSAALGAQRPAYRVRSSAGLLLASSPAQRLGAHFQSSGAELRSGAIELGLGLRAIGYGNSLAAVSAVAPRANENRVTYAHPGLSEWYANGPLGIEQGFTVQRAPAARGSGPLTLALGLSGNGSVTLSPGARAITIKRGSASLRYGGLTATDGSGRALRSWLEVHRATVLIRVDARGARYPLRVDPLVQQGGKLVPSDEEGGSEAGTSVAISADGNTALVGGIGDEAGEQVPMAGAAWVFSRTGATWNQQGPKLTGNDEEGEGQFGISVALSADGNTALIGGINDESAKKQFGAAWVFTRAGATWSQQGPKLVATPSEESQGGRFGRSVALSADGNTALIGAYFDANSISEPQSGSAFVFTRSGSSWKQQGTKLTGSDEGGLGQFGFSASLSADGNTALIGGPNDEGATKLFMSGAAWVFTRAGASWSQQGPKLTGSGETGPGELGWSLALAADGDTALVGAPGDEDGAAFAFIRSGSSWTQQGAKMVPSDATMGAGFGAGVAISAEGSSALIGGPVDKDSTVPTGAAWEFAREGSTWSQQGTKMLGAGEVPESEFGAGVALSADGDTALLGGPIDNTVSPGVSIGAAWAFVNPPPSVTTNPASALGATTATLKGIVDAGASNVVRFQFGPTTAYGSQTSKLSLPPSSAARGVGATLTNLTPGATYHFRLITENSAGTSLGADQAFTTTAGAPGGTVTPISTPTTVRPIVSDVKQSHRRWRTGSKLARLSATATHKAPLGTTFSFKLNEAASIVFKFTQPAIGRKVNGKCIAQTNKNRARHACKRTLTRGTLSFAAHTGADKVVFQGAISRSKKLKPGSYTCVISATSRGLRSPPKSLGFTIVK